MLRTIVARNDRMLYMYRLHTKVQIAMLFTLLRAEGSEVCKDIATELRYV